MSPATSTRRIEDHTAFPTGYAGRDVARLLGMTAGQLQAYVRSGCIEPKRDSAGEQRFSFQDLILLLAARALTADLPPRKVYRAIRELRQQLPRGRAITAVRLSAEGDNVVVHDGAVAWEPASGQALLGFDVAEFAARVEPLARRNAAAAEASETELDAEDWYGVACDLEPFDEAEARRGYTRALEIDPTHVDARLNLGRMLHESADVKAAESHYRRALDYGGDHPIAWFNLAVALEDLGRPVDALDAYEAALRADPEFADAHYNLAALCEKLGDAHAALRHLQIFRGLQQRR
jgi:tetratricopeptide (TPR) repeat protein